MFYAVWDFFNSKQKVKQYKQSNLPKSYKTEIKILANPGLAYQASNNQHRNLLLVRNHAQQNNRWRLLTWADSTTSKGSLLCTTRGGYKWITWWGVSTPAGNLFKLSAWHRAYKRKTKNDKPQLGPYIFPYTPVWTVKWNDRKYETAWLVLAEQGITRLLLTTLFIFFLMSIRLCAEKASR